VWSACRFEIGCYLIVSFVVSENLLCHLALFCILFKHAYLFEYYSRYPKIVTVIDESLEWLKLGKLAFKAGWQIGVQTRMTN